MSKKRRHIEGDKYQELIQGIIPVAKDGVTFFSESKKIAGANNFLLSIWTFESNRKEQKGNRRIYKKPITRRFSL